LESSGSYGIHMPLCVGQLPQSVIGWIFCKHLVVQGLSLLDGTNKEYTELHRVPALVNLQQGGGGGHKDINQIIMRVKLQLQPG
jgi:hypothetical protein